MREFALVVLNNKDEIIDIHKLEYVTEPSGLGFSLDVSSIETEDENIITAVTQKKQTIKFNINQVFNSYDKSAILVSFIQKYSRPEFRLALKYTVNKIDKFCEGRVVNLTKTEMNEFKNLVQSFDFMQTTTFFVKKEGVITIKPTNEGKGYPFGYPYKYGLNFSENIIIANKYIQPVPVNVEISGEISNPIVSLVDKETGEVYNSVKFDNFVLEEDEKIIIDSVKKKITKTNTAGIKEDILPETDPAHDSFLKAKVGKSEIIVNSENAGIGFEVIGVWREYTL